MVEALQRSDVIKKGYTEELESAGTGILIVTMVNFSRVWADFFVVK